MNSSAARGLWDEPTQVFADSPFPAYGVPSWYHTERVIEVLVAAANVTQSPTATSELIGHAQQLLAEAEHLFDQERLRGTNDTGEQMRESFQVVGAKLRRARELLRDRPGDRERPGRGRASRTRHGRCGPPGHRQDDLAMLLFATSDKGGTGRSVTGSNVVYRRALQGGDVCYVDFDFGSPTAGAIFGISALSRGTTTGSGTHSYLLAPVALGGGVGRLAALRPQQPPAAAAWHRPAGAGAW